MTRLFRIAILIAIMFSAKGAFAAGANWYVQKGATGSNNGTSWTNAWNEMNQINFSTVACGDTIWLAGGTYTTGLSVNKNCTAGNVLTIERVLSTDTVPASAPGWNSAFDSQVVIQSSQITIGGGNYWTIDGRIGTTAGNNFGIAVQYTSGSGGNGIFESNSVGVVTNITFSHVELMGPPCSATDGSCSGGSDGLNLTAYGNPAQNVTFDHGWIHRWGEAIRYLDVQNSTVQYTDIDTVNDGNTEHADVLYATGATNWTFRYNRVWGVIADGIFFDGSQGPVSGINIYGNVFYHNAGSIIDCYPGTYSDFHIYNNVFIDDGQPSGNHPSFLYIQSTLGGTSAIEDNVFDGVSWDAGSVGTADYNAFSTKSGKQDSGTHSLTYTSGGQFVNAPDTANPIAADFHLTSTGVTTFQNGIALPSPFNVDADGNVEGANGTALIGAYQNSGSQSQAPQPPTGLVATAQ